MYLNKELISKFEKDIKCLLEGSARSVSNSNYWCGVGVDFIDCGSTVAVTLYGDNGFTKSASKNIADKVFKCVSRNIKVLANDWKGIFNLDLESSYSRVGGEGEYTTDYGPEIILYFTLGDKLNKSSVKDAKEYKIAMSNLSEILSSYNCNGILTIKDDGNGSTCSIGEYFKYRYSDGAVKPVNFISPDRKGLLDISKSVSKVFNCLAKFNVPIDSVIVRGFYEDFDYKEGIYFYDIGNGECKLWCDIAERYHFNQ